MKNGKLQISATLALGALVTLSGPIFAADSAKTITFTKDIAPILQSKCEDCHRKGAMAPMSLITYQEVRPWAKSIKSRVLARSMPPWFMDKTVGIQHFANDVSLTDQQIATIAKWVDSGAPQGDPEDMPPPKSYTDEDTWKLAKQFGAPDLILKSEPYTMPAHGQDVWFKPLTDVNISEPRWVRAVEIRPSTPAGRRVFHHVLARLLQDDTPATMGNSKLAGLQAGGDDGGGGGAAAGLLMEWAVGKNYDIYRPNSGKLLLPGAKIWWEMHYHAVGEQITDHVELGVWLYPKSEPPKYRDRLMAFGLSTRGASHRHPAESTSKLGLQRSARPPAWRTSSRICTCAARRCRWKRSCRMATTQMVSYVDHFNFNWMTNYIYADDAAPVLPEGHHHSRHILVRQHDRQQVQQPGSESVGWIRRPHGRRDGPRVDQRHLYQR